MRVVVRNEPEDTRSVRKKSPLCTTQNRRAYVARLNARLRVRLANCCLGRTLAGRAVDLRSRVYQAP
jgi:hypothetical protein